MLLYLPNQRKYKRMCFNFFAILLLMSTAWFLLGELFKPQRVQAHKASLLKHNMEANVSGELNLLTYNIAGLPAIISSASSPRDISIERIGVRIQAFDIVNVQEDFHYNDKLYGDNNHPYRTPSKGTVPFGDGLNTLSKYPIVFFERVAWTDCNGADCLTPKGFTLSRIQLAKDVFVDVYNIHATAQDDHNATLARQENILQLEAYIKAHSKGKALLLMGDFNAHYQYVKDNIKLFQAKMALNDAWVTLKNGGIFPVIKTNFEADSALGLTDSCESIDKIYYRNAGKIVFTPKTYKVEKTLFSTDSGLPLSDHLAISLKMEWALSL